MQFSTAILAIFAATAFAGPAPAVIAEREVSAVDSLQAAAQTFLDAKVDSGCEHVKCIFALAPTVVSCAAAAAEGGLNPIADASCIGSLTYHAIKRPEACKNC